MQIVISKHEICGRLKWKICSVQVFIWIHINIVRLQTIVNMNKTPLNIEGISEVLF